jgi:hypothetical protein
MKFKRDTNSNFAEGASMKLYKEILTKTLETIVNHYGKDHFTDLTKTFICPKCSTAYLSFIASDLILYSNAGSNGWRIYGVLEEDESLDRICDCQ